MAELQFAEPTTTMDANTQKVLSILPPMQDAPIAPPAPTPAPISRPSDNHAKPHSLPPVQQQIRETGQPYTPPQPGARPTSSTIGGVNNLRTSDQQKNFTLDPLREQANPVATDATGKFALGLYDQLSGANRLQENNNPNRDAITSGVTGGENLIAYEVGRRVGDELQNLGKDINKVRENLWKDRPKFELPEIKIPEFERPEIPKIQLPELPEFKIPEFKMPEPRDKDKPVPNPIPRPIITDKERILRELDISPCGGISFGITYVSKILGVREVLDGNGGSYTERISVPSTLDEIYGMWVGWWISQRNQDYYTNAIEWLESGGGTGSNQLVDLGNGVGYRHYQGIGNGVYSGGNPYGNGYPRWFATQSVIEVQGLRTKTAINAILDSFSANGRAPEIYKLSVSQPNNKDCPIGKPTPDNPPPPLPPKKKMCCPEIDYRRIKAMIDDAISKLDLVAAIPMSWQIRNEGNKPQLVIQCAEENGVDKDGNKKYKSAMYPISVPHWDGSAGDRISLPSYIKGNYEGIYTLNDNSKVTINAQNEVECKRILNAIKPRIPKQYTTDAYFKGGMIVRDKPIKESRVKPRYGRYFKDGQKNNKPDWRVDFS